MMMMIVIKVMVISTYIQVVVMSLDNNVGVGDDNTGSDFPEMVMEVMQVGR